MNSLYRFFFKPSMSGRYVWAWTAAICAITMFVFALLSFFKHLWFFGIIDLVMVIWNSLTCWANWGIYRRWKKNQPPT